MVNIGLIGCGYWGPNLLRNFLQCPDCHVAGVAELNDSQIQYLHEKFPSIPTTKDYFDLLNKNMDAIAIATPPSSHYALARQALEHNKHVLVEKPLALNVAEARHLVDLARERNLRLMVGHTFEYNAAIKELKHQIQKGVIGTPYYVYAQRLNFGIVRRDLGALWNLAPHDISILNFLFDQTPIKVSARGFDFIQSGIEDVAFIVLQFASGVKAHVQVSWLDPRKVRSMTIVGSEKMIVYDDMAEAKIQIYDKGIKKQNISDSLGPYDDFGKYQLIRSAGDVTFPRIDFGEPLRDECFEFVNAICENRKPTTDGENGLRVVEVLAAAQESMRQGGKEILIEPKNSELNNSRAKGLGQRA